MSPREKLAARLIGTPLERPAMWFQAWRGRKERAAHPELAEWYAEGSRTEAVLQRIMRPDLNCIDIGCHIGSFLRRICTMAPRGRHYAVEPVPDKAAWLQAKFPRVTVVECALADQPGTVDFFVNDEHTSYSGLKPRSVSGELKKLQVQRRRLDDVIPVDARIGFIKIDVNGAELNVLKGAQALLARDQPFVHFECTKGGLDDYGIAATEVYDFITGPLGYRVLLLKEWLADGPALSRDGFVKSMEYPFQAFNYAVVPAR